MKRLVILGGGESGVGAAVLAQKKGYDVFVSDFGLIADNYKTQLNKYAITWEEGQHTSPLILNANEVVKSPGIPDTAPIIQQLLQKKCAVISEIEFAARFTNAKLIGVTGSNGKTTTTLLLYSLLQKAGLNVGLAGNIGQSFALQVALFEFDIYVLELSSFQLDGMFSTQLDTALLMNITPDHLDRYNYNFELYTDSKFRITQNQDQTCALITNYDDRVIQNRLKETNITKKTNTYNFSALSIETDTYLDKGTITADYNDNTCHIKTQDLQLLGRHNYYNVMAATIAALRIGLTPKNILNGLNSFQSVEHRLEEVAQVDGVRYINDSKATNVDSTWYALECMPVGTTLIMGGVDKGNDYTSIKTFISEKVNHLICLGIDNKKLLQNFNSITKVSEVQSMNEAIALAHKVAYRDGAVLLSPACASFDLFKNYEDRGKQFKTAVHNL